MAWLSVPPGPAPAPHGPPFLQTASHRAPGYPWPGQPQQGQGGRLPSPASTSTSTLGACMAHPLHPLPLHPPPHPLSSPWLQAGRLCLLHLRFPLPPGGAGAAGAGWGPDPAPAASCIPGPSPPAQWGLHVFGDVQATSEWRLPPQIVPLLHTVTKIFYKNVIFLYTFWIKPLKVNSNQYIST